MGCRPAQRRDCVHSALVKQGITINKGGNEAILLCTCMLFPPVRKRLRHNNDHGSQPYEAAEPRTPIEHLLRFCAPATCLILACSPGPSYTDNLN